MLTVCKVCEFNYYILHAKRGVLCLHCHTCNSRSCVKNTPHTMYCMQKWIFPFEELLEFLISVKKTPRIAVCVNTSLLLVLHVVQTRLS